MFPLQVQTGVSLVVVTKNLCDKLPKIGRYFLLLPACASGLGLEPDQYAASPRTPRHRAHDHRSGYQENQKEMK